MRFATVLMLGVITMALSGCGESARGHELCEAVQIERHCGIYEGECLEALRADERFVESSTFGDWSIAITDDNRCELTATDFKMLNAFISYGENEVITFDIGSVNDIGDGGWSS